MLQFRKQISLLLAFSVLSVISATNRVSRSVSDAEYLTIIVDETMRNLLKQCNKSVVYEEDKRCRDTAEDRQDLPITIKQLTELMEKTVRSLSDSFTARLLQRFPKSCADIIPPRIRERDGVYSLHISGYTPINVYCLSDSAGGCPWTVVQRRQDKDTDFNLNWANYKAGFGDPHNSYFLGMEALYWLTSDSPHELQIVMRWKADGVEEIAHYDHFAIGDEGMQYSLNVLGKFSGNAADELSHLRGYKFRTKDRVGYCIGKEHDGGWWKEGCSRSKLNGMYAPTKWEMLKQYGIIWDNKTDVGQNYSLSYVHMAIRPKHCYLSGN